VLFKPAVCICAQICAYCRAGEYRDQDRLSGVKRVRPHRNFDKTGKRREHEHKNVVNGDKDIPLSTAVLVRLQKQDEPHYAFSNRIEKDHERERYE